MEAQIRTMRSTLEAALQMPGTIYCAFMMWMLRHAAWVLTRFQVRSDGFTACKKIKKRGYNGDVAKFCKMVRLREAGKHMGELDDGWLGSVLWLGKSDQGDEHLVALQGGKVLATGRSIRRLPMASQWSAEAVRELGDEDQDVKLLEPRRRYLTNDCVLILWQVQ